MKMDDAYLLKSLDQHATDGGMRHTQPGALSLESRMLRGLLHALGDPPIRMTLWNGESVTGGDTTQAVGGLHIANRATLLRLAGNPNLYFGEGYSDGSIQIDGDLATLLEAVYRHRIRPNTPWSRWFNRAARWVHHCRRNTFAASRGNIHRHYDLGNDFYRLWLDQRMSYSCAYFPSRDATLEQACGRVSALYGEPFVRAWRLYLSGSLAAFNTGELQLFQLLFTRASDNAIPWTRAHLYSDKPPRVNG